MREYRYKRGQQSLQQADTIRRADIAAGRATNLKEFGFDFPIEQIDQRIRRKDQLDATAIRTLAGTLV